MTDKFHKEQLKRLQSLAHYWHKLYAYIDEEEAYSELLLQYGIAVTNYNEASGTAFSTYFYKYKLAALRALCSAQENFDAELNEDVVAMEGVYNLLYEIDKTYLTEDAKTMLNFILTTDFSEERQRMRIGKNTIMELANKKLGWTYNKAAQTFDMLKIFYLERVAV